MNKIILIGRITKELELRYTPNNKKPVCEFTLAVNRDKENADFITIQSWNEQAENLSKYQGKGSLIGVFGELRVQTYDKEDGTKGYKTYVLANNIEYLESKKQEEVKQETTEEYDPFKEFGETVQIEDNFLD